MLSKDIYLVRWGGTCISDCLKSGISFNSVNENQCNEMLLYYYTGSSCEKRPTDGSDITCTNGYTKSGNNCINCTAAGKVEWQGQCYDEYPFCKKRWTPTEAAEWLHDGNDNFVILTFKK